MADDTSPVRILSSPGVKRDGTRFDGGFYVDAQWCRFDRGLPRKIGGYRAVTAYVPEISRNLNTYTLTGTQYLHTGGSQFITQLQTDSNGVFLGVYDRTPLTGFVAGPDTLWQFEVIQDKITAQLSLIAFPGQNLANIDSTAVSNVFIGDLSGTGPLVDMAVDPESGGIAVIGAFLFKFGSGGHVAWSKPNEPADFSGTGSGDAYITPGKIVKALPLRGGGVPAALFWSLGMLVRATYGSTAAGVWDFDEMAATSVLSAAAIVEYDGIYYWPGVSRFMAFNGVQQTLDNRMNRDWFFDNLNYRYRQKVYAYKVPRYNEIWWCYPRGNATECTHAIIYNVVENTWYDTALPATGRSTGQASETYGTQFMIDTTATVNGYTLWQHESGFDEINNTQVNPILSYFTTHELSMLTLKQAMDKSMRVVRLEPDFVQGGTMQVQVQGRPNAQAPLQSSALFNFDPAPVPDGDLQTVPLKALYRLMSFKFLSNTAGGNYYMGNTLAHVGQADGRVRG